MGLRRHIDARLPPLPPRQLAGLAGAGAEEEHAESLLEQFCLIAGQGAHIIEPVLTATS
jgi:hypothetical protein